MILADAEKLPGNRYWTLYDGRGGIWHAVRDGQGWRATRVASPTHPDGGPDFVSGKLLRNIRAALVFGYDWWHREQVRRVA